MARKFMSEPQLDENILVPGELRAGSRAALARRGAQLAAEAFEGGRGVDVVPGRQRKDAQAACGGALLRPRENVFTAPRDVLKQVRIPPLEADKVVALSLIHISEPTRL